MRVSRVLLTLLLLVTMGGAPLNAAPAAALSCGPGATFGLGLVQSTWGADPVRNFEAVFPRAGGGFQHYFRQNTGKWAIPWYTTGWVGSGGVDGTAVLQSNYAPGHLEVVATTSDGRLLHYWRDDGGTWQWSPPTLIASGVKGQPGFVQSRWGTKGNFEVVAPLAAGGLGSFFRDNDSATIPWHHNATFGGGVNYDAVSMVNSSYGGGLNLEVIARTGTTLHQYYRDANTIWHGPYTLTANGAPVAAKGTFSLIQSKWGTGTYKNFELVVPLAAGGLAHYWRDNAGSQAWIGPGTVDGGGDYTAAALIQGTYQPGHLEVVARKDETLVWTWRDDGGTGAWSKKYPFGAESPACAPATTGAWSDPIETGIVGIHSTVLPNGKVLWFAFQNDSDHHGHSLVFDPATNKVEPTSAPGNLFCSGHTLTPDGRVWVAGGHMADVNSSHTFNPVGNTWTKHGSLGPGSTSGRWYPTNTVLPNGQVFTISGTHGGGGPANATGSNINNTWQVFNPATNTVSAGTPVTVAPFSTDGFGPVDLYPFVYVVPSGPQAGKVMVHARQTTRFLNVTTNSWSGPIATRSSHSRTYPAQGTSVMLTLSPSDGFRARVLVMGGAGTPLGLDTPAHNGVELLDLGTAAPSWRNVAPMKEPRVMPDSVILPNGEIFVVGGSRTGKADLGDQPVLAPEIYDPAADTWTRAAPMRVPRLYHSTAVLLPDARVLVAGRDGLFNAMPYKWPENRAEIYSPPYLFAGTRPVITSAPSSVAYGATFTAGVGAVPGTSISRAVLIKLGSATHGFDMGQRAIQLPIVGTAAGGVSLQAPPNSTVAPPGHYMLFVSSAAGVPSVAKIVKL
ncbi:galactose oxidase-like domain-containing protein [Nonomuraea longicatena]|uniref:Glyoxal oxidase n=1 Tax=Nonomuraea longicatena TaxID=83682 RepID=A0ABP4AP91_9ACTN